jgi:hypothetical protein
MTNRQGAWVLSGLAAGAMIWFIVAVNYRFALSGTLPLLALAGALLACVAARVIRVR